MRKRSISARETLVKDYEQHCEDDLQSLGDDNSLTDDICVNDRRLSHIESHKIWTVRKRVSKMMMGHEVLVNLVPLECQKS